MAMVKAQAQSISNYFHYAFRNHTLNNEQKASSIKGMIAIIDPLLIQLGGAPLEDPKTAS
jgi:hypothetical protein